MAATILDVLPELSRDDADQGQTMPPKKGEGKGKGKSPKEPTETVRLHASFLRKLKLIAHVHDVTMGDWIEEQLGQLVAEEYVRAVRRLNLEVGEDDTPPTRRR